MEYAEFILSIFFCVMFILSTLKCDKLRQKNGELLNALINQMDEIYNLKHELKKQTKAGADE